jgi:hypothetical protein
MLIPLKNQGYFGMSKKVKRPKTTKSHKKRYRPRIRCHGCTKFVKKADARVTMKRLYMTYNFPEIYHFHLLCYNTRKIRSSGPVEEQTRKFSLYAKGRFKELTANELFCALQSFELFHLRLPSDEKLISLQAAPDTTAPYKIQIVLSTRVPYLIRKYNCRKMTILKHKQRKRRR